MEPTTSLTGPAGAGQDRPGQLPPRAGSTPAPAPTSALTPLPLPPYSRRWHAWARWNGSRPMIVAAGTSAAMGHAARQLAAQGWHGVEIHRAGKAPATAEVSR